MMNRTQFLLMKLAEEASEVAQIALKTAQFGLEETYTDKTNVERIYAELNDIIAIVGMLNEQEGFDYDTDDEAIDAKIKKVEHYLKYSQTLGMVDGNNTRSKILPVQD